MTEFVSAGSLNTSLTEPAKKGALFDLRTGKPFQVGAFMSGNNMQCFGSGSRLDTDSIRSVSYPDSESGSGSRRLKMTHKSRKKIKKFNFLKCGCSLIVFQQ
jgi:hypothetical protein